MGVFALAGVIGVLGFALAVRAWRFRGPILPAVEAPTGIVDMHCHTAGIGAGGSGALISQSLRRSWRFSVYLRIFGTSVRELQAQGDAALMAKIAAQVRASRHVDRAVVLAMDAPYRADGTLNEEQLEVYVPNRFVGETTQRHPELCFGASVHPFRRDALEELEWSRSAGAVLLKWLPNIQGIDPADERLRPFYAKLVELNLPLLTHTGDEDSFSRADNSLGDPRRLVLPLQCGVRVIAAHVASAGVSEGQCNAQRLLEMLPLYPNLFADLSTLTQINRSRHLQTALSDPRLEGRLMYGTDHPLTNTPLVTPWQFPLRLTLAQMWQIGRIRNPWDRDVALKAALGTPVEVFTLSRRFLEM